MSGEVAESTATSKRTRVSIVTDPSLGTPSNRTSAGGKLEALDESQEQKIVAAETRVVAEKNQQLQFHKDESSFYKHKAQNIPLLVAELARLRGCVRAQLK